MIRTINLEGQEIEYNLIVKNVKNINLRIKPDESISISANKNIKIATIEQFIISKSNYILTALKRYHDMSQYYHITKEYVSGETIRVLGHNRRLVVVTGTKNDVQTDESYVYLKCKNIEDYKLKEKLITKWLNEKIKTVVYDICKENFAKFEKYGVKYPEIKFRNMISRWGSCQPKRGIITFNYSLINASLACIEYVVIHEFTHFLQPNHSKKFYWQLAMFMPDWKERKKQLDTEVIQGL